MGEVKLLALRIGDVEHLLVLFCILLLNYGLLCQMHDSNSVLILTAGFNSIYN